MHMFKLKSGYLVAIILTIIAVGFLFYASIFGYWVNNHMKAPIGVNDTQELFDTTSPFSEALQGSQGASEKVKDPTSAPTSTGPSYPPPSN